MKELKNNRWVWILLIGLTLIGVLLNGMSGGVYLIVLISTIKFLGVLMQFVETKNAHVFWKVTSSILALIFIVGIIILY
ncbi:hypothetical protein KFE94_06680 [bacterium SCSIO 12643]|nr:hypothetical protein KFE94_06680 [bacterium SCSIO 12643]